MIQVGIYNKELFVTDAFQLFCEKGSTEFAFAFGANNKSELIEKLSTTRVDILIYEIDFPLGYCKQCLSDIKLNFADTKCWLF